MANHILNPTRWRVPVNCSQIRKLLHAHHDGELDAAHAAQVDEHIVHCQHCFDLTRNLLTLRHELQSAALRFFAPTGFLRAAITQTLRMERDMTSASKRFRDWAWAIAATLLVAAILAFQLRQPRSDDRLLADLTASHIRSLMANHLTDVASTDQHTVKPWFIGRLNFAPPVKDLYSAGFPLLGCRLDYVADHAVAALVYARQNHTINLFIWPAESSAVRSPSATERNEYRIVRWSDGRMNLVAVSDLSESELRGFAVSFCHGARQPFPP
jgi:anti-sigma factor RsiW